MERKVNLHLQTKDICKGWIRFDNVLFNQTQNFRLQMVRLLMNALKMTKKEPFWSSCQNQDLPFNTSLNHTQAHPALLGCNQYRSIQKHHEGGF